MKQLFHPIETVVSLRERVYPSDIKKLLTWYNILIGAEITDFTPEEEPATEEAEAKEDTNAEAKAE